MEQADFTQPNGRLTPAIGAYAAFVPAPLYPNIEWSIDLVKALSSADQALGKLAGVGQSLVNPQLLMQPFLKREAVLSSRIEGTMASLSDLFFFEAAPSQTDVASDVREVANYIRALEVGLRVLRNRALGLNLLRDMHRALMEGVRGGDKRPGEFRRDRNWIGPRGCRLDEATYVPPPPEELPALLDAFEKALHERTDVPPLARFAALHYQFEAIHPFMDGNGRIGRLLVTLLLCVEGLLPHPLLYLSAFFERHRDVYYRNLLAVSQSSSWNEWLRFFLRGVHEEATDAVNRAHRLVELRERFRRMFHEARSSALLLKLIDELFHTPVITVPRAVEILGVTYHSAQDNVGRLVKAGVLKEATGKKRGRIYVARQIIQAVERPLSRN
jgi:Fic family protein